MCIYIYIYVYREREGEITRAVLLCSCSLESMFWSSPLGCHLIICIICMYIYI